MKESACTRTKEDFFQEVYETSFELCEETLKAADKHPSHMPVLVESLEDFFYSFALLKICAENDLIGGRKYFYKATLAREWLYVEFIKKEYEVRPFSVSTYAYKSLYNAILSGNKERAIHMAQLFGSIKVEDVEEFLPNVLLGNGLKYVILDDKIRALEYVQKLEDSKGKRGMKQYVEGHACAFRGIIERDEEEFNKGLEYMLRHHVQRTKRAGCDLDAFFPYDSIALAMLAKERGLAITVKHDLFLVEYLENMDIDYSKLLLFSMD